jgi:hypothetical protein
MFTKKEKLEIDKGNAWPSWTTGTDPEVHEVAPEDLGDLLEMLAADGRTVIRVEVLDDGALYRCTCGPWPC